MQIVTQVVARLLPMVSAELRNGPVVGNGMIQLAVYRFDATSELLRRLSGNDLLEVIRGPTCYLAREGGRTRVATETRMQIAKLCHILSLLREYSGLDSLLGISAVTIEACDALWLCSRFEIEGSIDDLLSDVSPEDWAKVNVDGQPELEKHVAELRRKAP